MLTISIIVPVYNVEAYLPRCIDSILGQSFKEWELLLVNDGSTDRSGNICDEYTLNDSRIKTIHKENGGVSSARNVGMDNACGKYITFIDADDYVGKDYCKVLLDSIESKDGIDFACCSFCEIDSDKRKNYPVEAHYDLMSLNRLWTWSCVWGGIFRSDIIKEKKIQFLIGIKNGEDMEFIFRYLRHCREVILSSNIQYYYCRRSTSATATYNSKYIEGCIKIFPSLKAYYESREKLNILQRNALLADVALDRLMAASRAYYRTTNWQMGVQLCRRFHDELNIHEIFCRPMGPPGGEIKSRLLKRFARFLVRHQYFTLFVILFRLYK